MIAFHHWYIFKVFTIFVMIIYQVNKDKGGGNTFFFLLLYYKMNISTMSPHVMDHNVYYYNNKEQYRPLPSILTSK